MRKFVVERYVALQDAWVVVSNNVDELLAERIATEMILRSGDDGLGYRVSAVE